MPGKYDPLPDEQIRAVEILSEVFAARSIRYALVGGLATLLRGQPRFTQDVDVLKCPHVHALGHPTGRLIGKRKGYDVDLDTIFRAAADYGCLLELNSQPDRLDLDDTALMAAKERGAGIVANTDAHSVEELEHMEFGVYQARRAGLEARDVANTRTLTQFRKGLKR